MKYSEFKKAYRYSISIAPDVANLYNRDDIKFICTITTDIKNGTRWIKTAETVETADTTYYLNTVEAIPFFRNLGGYERTEKEYTYIGYIPTKVTSISPDKNTRVIRVFKLVK